MAFALAWLLAVSGESAIASFGTLVLQAPVQAVASLNGEGAFLLVPGQDLQWNRLTPGTYRIAVVAGTQQWTQEVDLRAGKTETRVASLSSPGTLLPEFMEGGNGAGALPLPPPPPPRRTPAFSAPAQDPAPATVAAPAPVQATPQPRVEDTRQDIDPALPSPQEERQKEREERDVEQQLREAERRARQAEKIEKHVIDEPAPQQKKKRPKVH